MNRIIYFGLFILFFVSACTTSEKKEDQELTPAEKHVRDSLSKIEQRLRADSLKNMNPLLIMPPDSNYTGDYNDKYSTGITKFKGFFRFGKRHGQWMSFYPNGLLWSEMHYDKGTRSGPNMTYYIDGKTRYSGFYKNDFKDSTWNFFDSTGTLLKKIVYQKGRMIKEIPVKQ